MDISKVTELADKIRDTEIRLKSDYRKVKSSLDTAQITLSSCVQLESRLAKVSESLKLIQSIVSEQTVEYVQEFLTKGLRSVYCNRQFKVILNIGDRGNRKTLKVFIEETKEDGSVVVSSLNDGSGGGIQVVIAFLLQVLTILNWKLTRVIFLDEALSAVSSEYLPGLFELIRELIDRFGFSFLSISQDPRFISYSTSSYTMVNGSLTKSRTNHE